MSNHEYAIKSVDVHGNWAVESKRYTNTQDLVNAYRERAEAITSGAAPTDVFRPLVRIKASHWVELNGENYENLNALTLDRFDKIENRPTHFLIETEEYERLVSAAMAYAYQLHPTYGSTRTWHGDRAGVPNPTQGCSVTDGPPWAKALFDAAKATINQHVRLARSKGFAVDLLQTEHPEHNQHAHNPRPYSGPYTRDRIA